MQMRLGLLLVIAALIVAVICVAAPQINVTLNEDGTEVSGIELSSASRLKEPSRIEHAAH